MVHFVIEDIPNLTILANLINGRLRTEFKDEAYVKWINRLNKKGFVKNKVIVEPLNPQIDLNWLAGFTEGDGSFFIGLGNSPKSKLGVQVTLNISWTQKHRKTLELIASQFKGTWSYNKTHKFWVYNIKRKSEIQKVLFSVFKLFTAYLNVHNMLNPYKVAKLKSFERFLRYMDMDYHLDPSKQTKMHEFIRHFCSIGS